MTTTFRRHAVIGWYYFLQALKVRMAYRADFFAQSFGSLIYGVVHIAIIYVIFQQMGTSLKGWTYPQVLVMYGLGELTFALFSITALGVTFALPSTYIIDGQLDRPLLRPLNTLFQIAMEQLNIDDWFIVLKGGAVVAWALSQPGTLYPGTVQDPLWWLASIAVVIGAACTYNGIFFTLTCASFWLKDRVSLTWPLFDFNEFSRYPLTIFPPTVRFVFSWIIPFGFVAFYPATIIMGAKEYWGIAKWYPLVAIAGNLIGYRVWLWGLRSYESSGS